jgi:hypothetical protein
MDKFLQQRDNMQQPQNNQPQPTHSTPKKKVPKVVKQKPPPHEHASRVGVTRPSEHVLFQPSTEQQTIIDAIKRGENVSVNAVAGSGKTTTILGIATQLPTKKILQITYNRALKLEVEHKAKAHKLENLKILTYHGLACSFYDYTCYTDDRIQEVIRSNKSLNRPVSNIAYDIVIIDEIQDMTPLYFELIHKFLFDIQRKVILGIMGDNFQGIYGFKGADERFLTLADHIFINHSPFTKLTLHTSYRLTHPMAHFVNQVMVGGAPRINTIKAGPPVTFIQYPGDQITDHIYTLITHEMQRNGIKAEDIFILAGTIRNQQLKELENKLVSSGILCFVPISEDSKLDERIIKDKVVFTTFHQSKGRERKLTIVYGFDSSFYTTFRDNKTSIRLCPNLLYVATTRSSQKLIIIENIKYYPALPFLKMSHAKMGEQVYIDLQQHSSLSFHKHMNNMNLYTHRDTYKPHDKTVTDLIKFIDETTLAQLSDLLIRVFKNTVPDNNEANTAIIPSEVKTGSRTYEQICDINGISIPAILFYKSNHTNRNYLWKFLVHNYLATTFNSKNTTFIRSYLDKLSFRNATPDKEHTIADWLLLGNIFLASTGGYIYKLKQITNYTWLTDEMIEKCHRNISRNIDHKEIMLFEHELGINSDQNGIMLQFNDPIYGDVILRGRVDLVTNDTVWELKCVDSLNIEHMLQLVLYAWIWNKCVEMVENNKTRSQKLDKYFENNATNENQIYDRKLFKLMNIRTGEIRELDVSNVLVNEIVTVLFNSKLRVRETLTDDQFIEASTARIQKYKMKTDNTFTLEQLIQIDEANKPILDF